jgi:hypothetical protein
MISYSRGEWHGVACAGATAVFDPDLSVDTIRAMWAALSAEPGPGAVIQVLVGSFGSSLGSLPSFAVAFCDPGADAVRLMVRGTARARITRADGTTEEVGGLGVATWSERTVPGAARVELAGFGEELVGYPLVDGVAGAGRLIWDLDDEAPPAGGLEALAESGAMRSEQVPLEPALEQERVSEPGPVVHDPEPEAPVAEAEEPLPQADDTFPSALGQTFVASLDETFGEEPDRDDPVPGVADDAGAAHDPHGVRVLNLPVEEATTGYDQLLWGETRTQLIEGAAVRAEAPAADPPASMMITGIPAAATAPAAPLGDHDGETVSAEHLVELQRRLGGAGSSNAGPAPVDPVRSLFGMPQAVSAAAVLVVSSGERVVLDRAAVVGRRPRAVRATGLIPHLVTVDSPNQDVSRSHVELRVEGSDVVATDLNTTNGTRLLRVGAEPVRLHPGEATLLVTGDRLDLGDEIVLAFEGL